MSRTRYFHEDEYAWLDAALTDASVADWMPALMTQRPKAEVLLFVDWEWGHLQEVEDLEAWTRYFVARSRSR